MADFANYESFANELSPPQQIEFAAWVARAVLPKPSELAPKATAAQVGAVNKAVEAAENFTPGDAAAGHVRDGLPLRGTIQLFCYVGTRR